MNGKMSKRFKKVEELSAEVDRLTQRVAQIEHAWKASLPGISDAIDAMSSLLGPEAVMAKVNEVINQRKVNENEEFLASLLARQGEGKIRLVEVLDASAQFVVVLDDPSENGKPDLATRAIVTKPQLHPKWAEALNGKMVGSTIEVDGLKKVLSMAFEVPLVG